MGQSVEEEINYAWRALFSEDSSQGLRSIAVTFPETIKLRAGRRFPSNTESILIGFNPDLRINSEGFPRGKGFCVEKIDLESEDLEGKWISLFREKDGSLDLFTIMVGDITDLLFRNSSQNQKTVLELFISRIHAWQEFMQRDKAKLGKEAEIGLFGEIHCLKKILDSGVSSRNAVEGWVGPERGIQDFNFGSFALEVKTTTASEGFPAKIMSLEQLDDSSVNPLFLFGCRLETDTRGPSLRELIEVVRKILKTDRSASVAFERKILFSGYLFKDEEEYNTSFNVSEENCYLVDEYFPRLTPYNVHSKIVKARYEINLDSINHGVKNFNEVIEMIGN